MIITEQGSINTDVIPLHVFTYFAQ